MTLRDIETVIFYDKTCEYFEDELIALLFAYQSKDCEDKEAMLSRITKHLIAFNELVKVRDYLEPEEE